MLENAGVVAQAAIPSWICCLISCSWATFVHFTCGRFSFPRETIFYDHQQTASLLGTFSDSQVLVRASALSRAPLGQVHIRLHKPCTQANSHLWLKSSFKGITGYKTALSFREAHRNRKGCLFLWRVQQIQKGCQEPCCEELVVCRGEGILLIQSAENESDILN